jgi:hypothetical protein
MLPSCTLPVVCSTLLFGQIYVNADRKMTPIGVIVTVIGAKPVAV